MIGTKAIPHRKDLVDFNYAVAGHAGTLCDPDGELFIKPCTQQEIEFYESANADHPAFAELMPVYMGTLSLNDATDIASINEQLPVVADHISKHIKEEVVALAHSLHPMPIGSADNDTSTLWAPGKNRKIVTDTAIVLENAAYGFKRPNIMDCKLGIRLWADDAPAEKKARFDNISANSTHKDLGFRISGMQVYRGTNDPSELDPEQYKKYDKDWGRKEVNKHNILESLSKFIFNPHAGVDDQTAREVAASFAEELRKVDDVLSKESSRMYSASLLFVVEGDGDALRDAVAKSKEADAARAKRLAQKSLKIHSPGRSDTRVDSGIGMDEDGDSVLAAEDKYDDDEDDDDDEANLPHVYSLRLIDFAHATWIPPKDNQTPDSDENVRLGVRKLIGLFDELSKERPSAS